MKVISGPTKWSTEKKCSGCKAVVSITIDDVSIGFYGANYGGDTPEEHICASCCVCGTDIRLDPAYSAPPLVLKAARARTRDKEI